MVAIFFNESIQNLHFLCRQMFERFISNLKLVLAFFPFKNMKTNIGSQIRTPIIIISSMGDPFPLLAKMFLALPPGGLGRGQKVKYSISFTVNFKDFLQTLCAFSQINIQNISDGIFILSPGSCPRSGN